MTPNIHDGVEDASDGDAVRGFIDVKYEVARSDTHEPQPPPQHSCPAGLTGHRLRRISKVLKVSDRHNPPPMSDRVVAQLDQLRLRQVRPSKLHAPRRASSRTRRCRSRTQLRSRAPLHQGSPACRLPWRHRAGGGGLRDLPLTRSQSGPPTGITIRSFSCALECKLQTVECLTLIGTEGMGRCGRTIGRLAADMAHPPNRRVPPCADPVSLSQDTTECGRRSLGASVQRRREGRQWRSAVAKPEGRTQVRLGPEARQMGFRRSAPQRTPAQRSRQKKGRRGRAEARRDRRLFALRRPPRDRPLLVICRRAKPGRP